MSALMPVLFLPHGGGPLPLLGDEDHRGLTQFLQTVPAQLGEPKAILVVTAHWEASVATVSAASAPGMIYDYYGFPPEAYELQYPAPGSPALAQQVADLLKTAGIDAEQDASRGFDHGTYVPLMLMYPQADIPVVQLSVLASLDPEAHIRMGQALAPLREQGVLILGSGLSFHNLKTFFTPDTEGHQKSIEFDNWLVQSCRADDAEAQLIGWEWAPHARYCHPREEHLLPLHVCFGAASVSGSVAELAYSGELMHKRVSALLWKA